MPPDSPLGRAKAALSEARQMLSAMTPPLSPVTQPMKRAVPVEVLRLTRQ
jgi:hypothetical protein